MGDYFQVIVDIAINEADAIVRSKTIRNWLIDEEIIAAKLTDCVLGSKLGFPPGPNYNLAAEEDTRHFLDLWTNGLDILVGRMFYCPSQGGFDLTCPNCHTLNELDIGWSKAMANWTEQSGDTELTCAHCSRVETVTRWRYEPNCGFGNLGLKFWNWPPLRGEFIKEVGARLGGNIVLVEGKL